MLTLSQATKPLGTLYFDVKTFQKPIKRYLISNCNLIYHFSLSLYDRHLLYSESRQAYCARDVTAGQVRPGSEMSQVTDDPQVLKGQIPLFFEPTRTHFYNDGTLLMGRVTSLIEKGSFEPLKGALEIRC